MELIEVTYVEIDIKYCSKVYGVTCSAAVGVTGDQKCFNTRNFVADCQVPEEYEEVGKTVRFGKDNGYLPADVPCIPNLLSADMTLAKLNPGNSIGSRSTVGCTFKNHPTGDAELDPYIDSRDYNPFEQGTFWGKWRARNPYIENQPLRVLQGYVGMDLADFDVFYFEINATAGPSANDTFSINGYDFMRLLSGKKSLAPLQSRGRLDTDYAAGATSLTLTPAGIGDEYPSSDGIVAVGQEIIEYSSRAGDVISGFTTVEDHDEGDIVQVVLRYTAQSSAQIVYDLVTNYTPLPAAGVVRNLAQWQAIAEEFSDTLFSADIVEPTAVELLTNELVEQTGLILTPRIQNGKELIYDVLRATSTSGVGPDMSRIVADSFSQADQPDKRSSAVFVYYNQRDVFKNLDEPGNFYSCHVETTPENLYTTEAFKKIYSRWINKGSLAVAVDVGKRALSRYLNPPRRFQFSLFATDGFPPKLGETVPITHRSLEDANGRASTVLAVITGLTKMSEGWKLEAEELNYVEGIDDAPRTFRIEDDAYNLNLRNYYDNQYSTVPTSVPITFIIVSGVVVGSTFAASYSLDIGDWPDGVVPKLVIEPGAVVAGRGGYAPSKSAGYAGGPAMRTTVPVVVDNQGIIGGGGGGGGGGFIALSGPSYGTPVQGGGGAGRQPGTGANPGTLLVGGAPSGGGKGGDLGQPGNDASSGPITGYPGGAAGEAITGYSLITFVNVGDIRGPTSG